MPHGQQPPEFFVVVIVGFGLWFEFCYCLLACLFVFLRWFLCVTLVVLELAL